MNPKHILVVEDEEHLADGISFNLEEDGYQVSVAADGPAALDIIANSPPVDLVILDLMLPGMSGYAVCEKLREAGHIMPILMLSARTLSEDRTRGFSVGADQYLTKPFELDELLCRVKNLLALHARRHGVSTDARPPTESDGWVAFGNARVNFATHEVLVSGKPVRMTPHELRLLQYFLDHPDRIIPRSELLEQVWELPPYTNTRAPDQFLSRLRKLFEPDPANPQHFVTVRDAGYRFLPDGRE